MLKKGDTVWFIDTCWTAESVGTKYIRQAKVIAADGLRFALAEPFRIFTVNEIGRLVFTSPYAAENELRKYRHK
jgi:hypothetical protein